MMAKYVSVSGCNIFHSHADAYRLIVLTAVGAADTSDVDVISEDTILFVCHCYYKQTVLCILHKDYTDNEENMGHNRDRTIARRRCLQVFLLLLVR